MPDPLHLVDATMFWSPTGGGVRRYLEAKHAWLAGQPGWRHSIAVPRVAGTNATATSLPSWPLPGNGGYRLPIHRRAIAKVLVGMRPDLIEAGDPYRVAWCALDAARTLGIPALACCHSNIVAMARLAAGRHLARAAARLAERYARRVYRGFDLVLAPSRSMAAHLHEWGVARVACQPLGVDTTVFHPRARDRSWRERHGWAEATRLLVYAGRFAPEKHLDVLAAAVERLGAPYLLLAIGAGPAPPPTSDRVVVLPFVASARDLATVLASADAFVHAGDQETFGLSALEAMACGTPAVLRASEGLAELADGERGAVGVRDGNAEAFAEAIAALFAAGLDGHSRAARERAENSDWERVFASLFGHYRRLVETAAGTPAQSGRDAAAAALQR
ncbi:MAG TPA: glycosyltransferase [Caldimonas sp.]|jgi:alpha-1,6-mannosyltransferase